MNEIPIYIPVITEVSFHLGFTSVSLLSPWIPEVLAGNIRMRDLCPFSLSVKPLELRPFLPLRGLTNKVLHRLTCWGAVWQHPQGRIPLPVMGSGVATVIVMKGLCYYTEVQ
jgi:hypothetical protein